MIFRAVILPVLFIWLFFSRAPALLASQDLSGISDSQGRIFLTDSSGGLWRCYATGARALPLQCKPAESPEREEVKAERITPFFVEDGEGKRYPVRYPPKIIRRKNLPEKKAPDPNPAPSPSPSVTAKK